MAKKRPAKKWRDFEKASVPESELAKVRANCEELGLTPEQTQEQVKFIQDSLVFKNNLYQVSIHNAETGQGWPEMVWLSIKRIDKKPLRDWRDLQRIKNELLGPEFEAVELFPAESRVTGASNQYHLWALKKEGLKFPFGFRGGKGGQHD